MNKLKYSILLTSLAGISLISCNDEYDYMMQDYTLSMKPHYVATYDTYSFFSGEGGSVDMYIMSEDTPWKLSGMPEWLSASPKSGSMDTEVTLTASENPSANARIAIYSLESSEPEFKYSQELTAEQSGGVPYIYFGSMGNTERYFAPTVTGAAQTVEIPMYTNLSTIWWRTENTGGYKPTNVSINESANKMIVDLPENSTDYAKTYSLAITPSQSSPYLFTRYVDIRQEPAAFKSIDHTNFNVSARPSSVQFTVDSEVEWNASYSASWIRLSTDSGSIGKTTVTVDILENASTSVRMASITLKSAGNKLLAVISITQSGMQLSFSSKELEFSHKGDSQDLTVNSDMDWSVIELPSWVKVSPESGKVGTTNVKVTVEDNNTISSRSAMIRFSASSYDFTVKVTQQGLPFSLDQTMVRMPWKASSAEVDLTCSGDWIVNNPESWVTVSPASGSDSGKLTITTEDNTTSGMRTALVKIRSENEEINLAVIQDSQIFIIDSTVGNFNVNGGSVMVSYRSNVPVKYSLTPDPKEDAGIEWVSCQQEVISDSDGKSTNNFTYTASPNGSSNPRAVYADMMPAEGSDAEAKTYRLLLRQPGRSIRCDVSRIAFFNNGGSSQQYIVDADGPYSIMLSDESRSWLTLDTSEEGGWFKLIAMSNTSKDVREAMLTISLKDLPDGEKYLLEIPVIQYPEGVVIVKDEWEADKDWGSGDGKGIVTIKLLEWSEDKNWNI